MGEPIPLTGKLRAGAIDVENWHKPPASPLIAKPQNQSLDKTFRAMEKASYERAEEAASMLNVPVSEVADIRMTNMKDNVREGDTSAIMPTPKAVPAAAPMTVNTVGAATAAMTRQGPLAGAGTGFLDSKIRRNHVATARAVQLNGQQGSYSGS
jgi:hypothetical protein